MRPPLRRSPASIQRRTLGRAAAGTALLLAGATCLMGVIRLHERVVADAPSILCRLTSGEKTPPAATHPLPAPPVFSPALPPLPETSYHELPPPAVTEMPSFATDPMDEDPVFRTEELTSFTEEVPLHTHPSPTQRPSPPTRPLATVNSADNRRISYTPPAYKSAPPPPYPASMRQSRVEGTVRLRIYLLTDGKPDHVEIVDSSGYAELDSEASSWVLKHWLFTPALRNHSPIPSTVLTRVRFVLQ